MKNKLFSEIPHMTGEKIEIRALAQSDAQSLRKLTDDAETYRFLPSFLFEKKYENPKEVIRRLYDECIEGLLILGILKGGDFCGLAELYDYRGDIRRVSAGIRLMSGFRGSGIAVQALELIEEYLRSETEIETIAASSMSENKASAAALKKCGFIMTNHKSPEDWGCGAPVPTDKWIKRICCRG